MKFQVKREDPLAHACQVLVLPCFEEKIEDPLLVRFDQALQGAVSALYRDREFTGALNTVKQLHTLGGTAPERLLLVGVGRKKDFIPERIRQAMGTAARTLRASFLPTCSIMAPETTQLQGPAAEGFFLGSWSFDHYRTKQEEGPGIGTATFLIQENGEAEAARTISEAERLCEAVRFTRDLVSHPGNVATPSYLADKAREMAARFDIPCHVWERDEIERHGMEALLAVGRGSRQQPRFITFDYRSGGERQRPIVIVGKGITFDSGGISLKPREGMEKMKHDMAGAAAVMGILMAAASLGLPLNLVGLIPSAENMPDGQAYRPGDVIRSASGKTIEIVNTDAEGRLILCDALHHAQSFRPLKIIDLATLTGACVVALGNFATGMLGSDEGLKRELRKAGEATGERVWELPLWDDYGELMKSDIADLKNSGGASAGTITAAWFLKNFAGTAPWVHLDIAGTAWEEKGRHYLPKGATGVGVRLLVEYLRGLC